MAGHRPAVPSETKRALVRETGGKCANPGCAARLTHLHHIRQWAVYRTHDEEHMIAICPTCHGHVHGGDLAIDDGTLYAWKGVDRSSGGAQAHLYIEPADHAKLLLGTIAFTSSSAGLLVFELSERNRLAFALQEGELFLLKLAVADRAGHELVRVVDGHVKALDEGEVTFVQRPGRVRLTVPSGPRYLATRAVELMRAHEPTFAADGALTMLDMEVVEPGLVRVQGIFTRGLDAIVITRERVAFVSPSPTVHEPVSMFGAGRGSVLRWDGPITTAIFRMGTTAEMFAAVRRPPPPPPFMQR